MPENPGHFAPKDAPQQAVSGEEYRGYNGRTLIQAFYRCKYESFRAATPGDNGKGILEKIRIRMYVMDVCMNSEGFFRVNGAAGTGFNRDLITIGDFLY